MRKLQQVVDQQRAEQHQTYQQRALPIQVVNVHRVDALAVAALRDPTHQLEQEAEMDDEHRKREQVDPQTRQQARLKRWINPQFFAFGLVGHEVLPEGLAAVFEAGSNTAEAFIQRG